MRSVAAMGAVVLTSLASLALLVGACSGNGASAPPSNDAAGAVDGPGSRLDASGDSPSTSTDGDTDATERDAPDPHDGNAIDGSELCTVPPLSALSVADTQINQPYPANAAAGGTIPPDTYFASADNFYQGSTFTAGTSRAMQVVIDANTLRFVTSTNGGPVEFQAFGLKYVSSSTHVAPIKMQLTGVCPLSASGMMVVFGYTFAANTLTLYDDAGKRVQTFSKE